jgi:hypothetical protein
MNDPRIIFKDRLVAGVLAWLIPGAGHLYQGRMFKGGLFFVCILATFMYGLALGDWQGVYYQDNVPPMRKRPWGYAAQIGVGLPALPALIQFKRFYSESNRPEPLAEPIEAPFTGTMEDITPEGRFRRVDLRGTISLRPVAGEFGGQAAEGTFSGTLEAKGEEPRQVEIKLSGMCRLGPPIGPDPMRELNCEAVSDQPGGARNARKIDGEIPRAFLNRVEVPLNEDALQSIHGRLGKFYELSLVYTWIAGLLNVLAIWDAVEGPAYGYGDEEEDEAARKKEGAGPKDLPKPNPEPTPAS